MQSSPASESGSLSVQRYEPDRDIIDPASTHGRLLDLVPDGARVLDVGCSTGYLGRRLRQRGCYVVGLDIDEEAVARASQVLDGALNVNIEDVDSLNELPIGSFTTLLLGDVLEHTRDPLAVLQRLLRRIEPGGSVVASVPNIAHASVRLELLAGRFQYTDVGILDRTHVTFYTLDSILALIAAAGLCINHFDSIDQPVSADTLANVKRATGASESDALWRVLDDPLGRAFQFIFRAHLTAGDECADRLDPDAIRARFARQPLTPGVDDSIDHVVRAMRRGEEQNEALARWAASLQQEVSLSTQQREQLEAWAQGMQAQLAASNVERQQVEVWVQGLLSQLAIANQQRQQLEAWAQDVESQMTAAREERQKLETWAQGLQDQLADAQEQIREIQHQGAFNQDSLNQRLTRLGALLPSVTVIVLGFNGRPYLKQCIDSVFAQGYPRAEVIFVDNASHDGSAGFVEEHYPAVRVIRNPDNLGYAGGNNVGIRSGEGDIFFLVNQDVELRPNCLLALIEAFSSYPDAGIVGCKIFEADGMTLQHAGGVLAANGLSSHIGRGEPDRGQYDEIADREYVTGAAIGIRRDVFRTCGLLDEAYFPAYYEETDLCVTARARGFRILVAPDAKLVHHEATSLGKTSDAFLFAYHRNRIRFVLKRYPPLRIVRESVPFEFNWLMTSMPPTHIQPVFAAYASGLRAIPSLLRQRLRERLHRSFT